MENIDVVVVSEGEDRHREDVSYLSSLPGFHVTETTPLSFLVSTGPAGYGTVALLELPFLQENEEEFLRIHFQSNKAPTVLVTDEPVRYLRYLGSGTVQLLLREPGYRDSLPKAVRDASEGARIIMERDTLEKRLEEYTQYLESINKIMEHDIGDLNQAILTFSELLNRTENRVGRQLVDNIIAQSKTVGNLINAFSKLTKLAKGNMEEIAFRPRSLGEAIREGSNRFRENFGHSCTVTVECPENLTVNGDAQLSELFEHSLSLLNNLQKGCRRFDIAAKEELSMMRSTMVTITPEGLPRNRVPKVISHVDDIDTLLRGNVDVMAVMILGRRYGGNVTIGTVEDGGAYSNFLSLLMPLSS
jgi:signal transduction histidine kinase